MTFELKDSGKLEEFKTGSRRDSREGKGRFDLIPIPELRRLAQAYERGAAKYGDDNWRLGQPLRRYVDSAMRHLLAAAEGQEDEDHIIQAAWNCFAFAYTLRAVREGRLPETLNDLHQERIQLVHNPKAADTYGGGPLSACESGHPQRTTSAFPARL